MQQNNTFDDFIGRKKEKAAKKKTENTLTAFIDGESDNGTIDNIDPAVDNESNSIDTGLPSDQE